MKGDVTKDVTVSEGVSQAADPAEEKIIPVPSERPPVTDALEKQIQPMMKEGDVRFGVTCTGGVIGKTHWLADSAVCGDMVMSLPSSILIAARSKEAAGVAVDMTAFLDSVVEGAAKLEGLPGVAACASLPVWAVGRLFGTFPVLYEVYSEAIDQAVLTVEAAAMKAAIGQTVHNRRTMRKVKKEPSADDQSKQVVVSDETSTEVLSKEIMADPTLSRLILTSRMKGRYKEEGGNRQAVQINILAAESRL